MPTKTAEQTIRTAMASLREAISLAETWHSHVDRNHHRTNDATHDALMSGRVQLRRLRETLREADAVLDSLRGRCWCHTTYTATDDDESEQRCSCADPGAMPPCSYCTSSED